MPKKKNPICYKKKVINFSLPLRIKASSKRDFILNLNAMRVSHYRTVASAKKNYGNLVKRVVPKLNYEILLCEITITLFPKTKRKMDVSNSVSIGEKFTLDALTDIGYWEDDDYSIIPKVTYQIGEVDKDNPRFEFQIIVKKSRRK